MKRFNLFLLAAMVLAFAACTPSENNTPKELTGISLNKKSIEIEVGGTYQLRVLYEPEDAEDGAPDVIWDSSKGRIASVNDNGKVEAKPITLDKTEAEVAVSGGSFTVNVDSELKWEVSCKDKRVTLSKSGSSVKITVSKFNLTSEECVERFNISSKFYIGRKFYDLTGESKRDEIPVTFTNGETTQTLIIRQEFPYIHVEELNGADGGLFWTYYYTAHTMQAKVESNIPWTVSIEYDATSPTGWASSNPSSGTGDGVITISYNANSDGYARSGYIWIKSSGGYTDFHQSDPCSMRQEGTLSGHN
ncbi:MAG: Ig-like domain-containing protein [Paludibacteraceae bacterium]|nr:Ig-like domain-containing protein [Paludibacteraceae bacterium]